MISDAGVQKTENQARRAIMQSIRAHLDASAQVELHETQPATTTNQSPIFPPNDDDVLVQMFCRQLESVGGHCIPAQDEQEAARVLSDIISKLGHDNGALRIALSDAALVSRLTKGIAGEEMSVCPSASELFGYDVGISSAQAAIAETGTLVLESEAEQNRLVSLLPPVHIALIEARNICPTLGDALRIVGREHAGEMSRAITLITGPSRTADIELTLTIGVHGPKEVHVIIIGSTVQ